ncbi:MAG: VCBS repeat-containing protein, partial [Bacteroidetes bacterium]|nr:VCBS repeat-containing protein [Bacteroidota bacterium]
MLLILNSVFSFGQNGKTLYNDFGFVKDISVTAKDSLNAPYKYSWAGGLNSCQLSKIDLNLDGTKDLFVFDRIGNRVLTFINNGTPNAIDYSYAPKYINKFPFLHNWVQLIDYNCDGKEDVFTYSGMGIGLYKNISDTALKFQLVSNQLLSFQYSGQIGIYSSTVDFPAIVDVDNDGDLDVLSFWVLGTYVQMHKNLSMETYGVCDSLKFELSEECWGKFAENGNTNEIMLNDLSTFCNSKNNPMDTVGMNKDQFRHSGSTLTAFDFDGDNDKDLLVGDVDFPQMKALTNGGTSTNALITSQDTLFPSYNTSIDVIAFPVASFLDIDNDNKNDLVVSPFDEKYSLYDVSENKKSMLFYKNIGTQTSPVFSFQKNNLFQDEMIDLGAGAYPVLFDYDNDGLKDLFVSNVGYWDSSYYSNYSLYSKFVSKIALFKNVGTASNPTFQLITSDFANLSTLKLNSIYPTFGDLDGDLDIDML